MSIIEEVKKVLKNISVREIRKQCEELNRQRVFNIPARKLNITHADNPENWTWSSIHDATTETNIEVAKMINVYWLQIEGSYCMRYPTPGAKYEVVFKLKLEETSYGWEEPVTLKLKLTMPDGTERLQGRNLLLDRYIGKNWVDIQVGEFEILTENDCLKILATLHQYVTTDEKHGLMVKGVAIRPVNQVKT